MKNLTIPLLFLFFCAAFFSGCEVPPTSPALNDAQQNFLKICREEHGLEIVTRQTGSTFWIYWPTEHDILDLQTKPVAPSGKEGPGTPARNLNFIDARFDNNFVVQYDITPTRKYVNDPGYGWSYTEPVLKAFNGIRSAISRSFANVEDDPHSGSVVFAVGGDVDFTDSRKNLSHKRLVHSYVNTDDAPEFFVIVIANIKKGVAFSNLVYIKDILRGMSDYYFSEEFNLRSINEELKGNPKIIGDLSGNHIDFHAVTWPEFLAKQIVHRVKFKYQRSDFPPQSGDAEEILKIVNDTVSAYTFDQFDGVVLEDLGAGTKQVFDKNEIGQYNQ